jgi:hypothetical protein
MEINCAVDNKTLFNFTKFLLYFPSLKSIKDYERLTIKFKNYQSLPDDVFSGIKIKNLELCRKQ